MSAVECLFATAFGGGAGGAGSILSVLTTQSSPLTITGSSGAAIRLSTGLTVQAGAGAVTFAGTGNVLIGGLPSNTSHSISNESSTSARLRRLEPLRHGHPPCSRRLGCELRVHLYPPRPPPPKSTSAL